MYKTFICFFFLFNCWEVGSCYLGSMSKFPPKQNLIYASFDKFLIVGLFVAFRLRLICILIKKFHISTAGAPFFVIKITTGVFLPKKNYDKSRPNFIWAFFLIVINWADQVLSSQNFICNTSKFAYNFFKRKTIPSYISSI